jgi:hypothetical protein
LQVAGLLFELSLLLSDLFNPSGPCFIVGVCENSAVEAIATTRSAMA